MKKSCYKVGYNTVCNINSFSEDAQKKNFLAIIRTYNKSYLLITLDADYYFL